MNITIMIILSFKIEKWPLWSFMNNGNFGKSFPSCFLLGGNPAPLKRSPVVVSIQKKQESGPICQIITDEMDEIAWYEINNPVEHGQSRHYPCRLGFYGFQKWRTTLNEVKQCCGVKLSFSLKTTLFWVKV